MDSKLMECGGSIDTTTKENSLWLQSPYIVGTRSGNRYSCSWIFYSSHKLTCWCWWWWWSDPKKKGKRRSDALCKAPSTNTKRNLLDQFNRSMLKIKRVWSRQVAMEEENLINWLTLFCFVGTNDNDRPIDDVAIVVGFLKKGDLSFSKYRYIRRKYCKVPIVRPQAQTNLSSDVTSSKIRTGVTKR
jgi:hypothetical protein